jgi:glutamate 5-kinase
MHASREIVRKARRVVVKVGTRVLLADEGGLDTTAIDRLLGGLIAARARGIHAALVSSGAIGAGLRPMGFSARPSSIPELQATAAVGQTLLMQTYNARLAPRGWTAAQILLTHEDFRDRQRYLNVRNTMAALEGRPILPVINENDTVSVDEIKFGDNDVLSALVANLVDADLLVILSDVDGLHDAPPRKGARTRRIDVVPAITPAIEALAGESGSGLGTGGMATKIRAARMAVAAGAAVVLAHGREASLDALLRGEPAGTLFLPAEGRLDHRKRWIAHSLRAAGSVVVDAGGVKAIREGGRSLLPAGVRQCSGSFLAGDAVLIQGPDGRDVAKGLSNYGADEIRRIQGRRTGDIAKILGYKYFDEVVHRNNMVVY